VGPQTLLRHVHLAGLGFLTRLIRTLATFAFLARPITFLTRAVAFAAFAFLTRAVAFAAFAFLTRAVTFAAFAFLTRAVAFAAFAFLARAVAFAVSPRVVATGFFSGLVDGPFPLAVGAVLRDRVVRCGAQ